MRKNVRNDKVVRAITIGLATMIAATSMPVTAFANDETPAAEAPVEVAPAAEESAPAQEAEAPAAEESAPAQEAEVPAQEAAPVVEAPAAEAPAPAVVEAPAAEAPAPAVVETPAAEVPAPAVVEVPAAEAPAPAAEVSETENEAKETEKSAVNKNIDATDNEIEKEDETKEGSLKKQYNDSVKTANGYNSDLEERITNNTVDTSEAKEAASKAKDAADAFNNDTDDYNKTMDNAGSAITDANTANTSDDKDTAYAAKDSAINELAASKEGLDAATELYNKAANAEADAKEKRDNAEKAFIVAQGEATQAINDLEHAKGDAKAVKDNLDARITNRNELEDNIQKLEKELDQLTAIKDQYYEVMVHYFRSVGAAKYDSNGKLNIQASAEEARDNNKYKEQWKDNTMVLCRQLMEELVKYKISEIDGVDASSIKFGEEGTTSKDAAYGELVEDKDHNDKVEVKKNISGAESKYWDYKYGVLKTGFNDGTAQLWDYTSFNNNEGRDHRVKATYNIVDKNGNVIESREEYYNYVFKDPKNDYDKKLYGQENKGSDEKIDLSLEKGPIYLVDVTGEGKNKSYAKDTDVNNYDDWSVLQDALTRLGKLDEYKTKLADIDKEISTAQNTLKAINEKIEELEEKANAKPAQLKAELDALNTQYQQAKDELDKAKATKTVMEDKYEEAKRAVESIDLSRFNTKPSKGGTTTPSTPSTGDDAGTTTDTPSAAPSTIIEAGGYTYTIPAALSGVDFSIFGGTAATVTTPTAGGVAGVREDAAGEIGGGAIEEAGEENEEGSEETVNPVEGNKIKNIDEGKVPLAAAPPIEEGLMINWWWFLVILLLGETGKKMYDDHMMKVKAREEADRAN